MSFLKRDKPSFLDRKELAKQERRLAAQQRERVDTGDDADDEVPMKLRQFHERNRAEQERRRNATDSERWFTVVFPTRAEKDAVLEEFGIVEHPMIPGTPGNKYVDGNALARALRALLKPT